MRDRLLQETCSHASLEAPLHIQHGDGTSSMSPQFFAMLRSSVRCQGRIYLGVANHAMSEGQMEYD